MTGENKNNASNEKRNGEPVASASHKGKDASIAQKESHNEEGDSDRYKHFSIGVGVLTVFFTAVIAFANWAYTQYAREQLDIMHATLNEMKADRRAWVGLKSAIIVSDRADIARISVKFTLTNFGETPAKKVFTAMGMRYDEVPLSSRTEEDMFTGFENVPGYPSISVLFPNNEISATTQRAFNTEEIIKMSQDRAWAYVVGFITYEDVYGDKHKTLICHRILPRNPVAIASCERFNEAY